jgi:hypothetical protein
VHAAQEIAWLQADVTWSVADGSPPLELDGAELDSGAAAPCVRFDGEAGSLVIPVGGAPLRCHALLYAFTVATSVTTPIDVELAARQAGEWRPSASYQVPGPGTYLGLVALEKKPRTIEGVRITLHGVSELTIYDLALLTFG